MKKCFFPLVIAVLVIFCSCKKGETVAGEERKQILAYADPIVDTLFKGYNESDMSLFSRDFCKEMKDGLGLRGTPPNDISWHTMNLGITGKYLTRTMERVTKHDGLVAVVYKAQFEKFPDVGVKVVFTKKGDADVVAGLLFLSGDVEIHFSEKYRTLAW